MLPWGELRAGHRVILESGRIVHVLPRVDGLPGFVALRNEHGSTRGMQRDPADRVPVLAEQQDMAVAALAAAFGGIEYLGRD